jgi:diaminopimelate epimerase
MLATFFKYQGTGNDFIMIDNRNFDFKINAKIIKKLCDRRFGIGADGLILLENDNSSDFKMVYFNADGNESTMCGNGGRCIVAFAKKLNIINNKTTFKAIDGLHEAEIDENENVHLKMNDVAEISSNGLSFFLNTGSPHHVEWFENIADLDIKNLGAKVRYDEIYQPSGCNVNFIQTISDSKIIVRTYERGVEDETLSCGTGVTAAAIAFHFSGKTKSKTIEINTLGGSLQVKFNPIDDRYEDVFLVGPATFVFEGIIDTEKNA